MRAFSLLLSPYCAHAPCLRRDARSFFYSPSFCPLSTFSSTLTPHFLAQQAGFDNTTNAHLADKLKKCSMAWVRKQASSWKLDDEFSRTAFVIADHVRPSTPPPHFCRPDNLATEQMGILKEGEFFFQSSDALPSPDGQGVSHVVIGPALLSRSPAIQPCDVQMATGVFVPEYRTFRASSHSLCFESARN